MRGGQPAADFDPEITEAKLQERTPVAPASVQLVKAVPSMVVTEPVRSGQSVYFPDGDVTIVGSVASGAEVVAGGSIHVLWRAARSCDGWNSRKCRCAHFLPQDGGRTRCHRWSLQDGRRHGEPIARTGSPALARRRLHDGRNAKLAFSQKANSLERMLVQTNCQGTFEC